MQHSASQYIHIISYHIITVYHVCMSFSLWGIFRKPSAVSPKSLAQVPRQFWRQASPTFELKRLYCAAVGGPSRAQR